eukprot:767570-Hanusia_phi.AAC.3
MREAGAETREEMDEETGEDMQGALGQEDQGEGRMQEELVLPADSQVVEDALHGNQEERCIENEDSRMGDDNEDGNEGTEREEKQEKQEMSCEDKDHNVASPHLLEDGGDDRGVEGEGGIDSDIHFNDVQDNTVKHGGDGDLENPDAFASADQVSGANLNHENQPWAGSEPEIALETVGHASQGVISTQLIDFGDVLDNGSVENISGGRSEAPPNLRSDDVFSSPSERGILEPDGQKLLDIFEPLSVAGVMNPFDDVEAKEVGGDLLSLKEQRDKCFEEQEALNAQSQISADILSPRLRVRQEGDVDMSNISFQSALEESDRLDAQALQEAKERSNLLQKRLEEENTFISELEHRMELICTRRNELETMISAEQYAASNLEEELKEKKNENESLKSLVAQIASENELIDSRLDDLLTMKKSKLSEVTRQEEALADLEHDVEVNIHPLVISVCDLSYLAFCVLTFLEMNFE